MFGDQEHAQVFGNPLVGSPPRVRGTAHIVIRPIYDWGITPACAGNSTFLTFNITNFKDHPRVCGEQGPFPEV